MSWCLVCGGLRSHLDSACSPTACGLLCGATCVVCLVCGVLISRVCGDSGILESRLTVPYNCQNRRFPKNGGPAVHPPWGHTIRWPPVGGSQRAGPEIKTPTQFCRCFTPLIPPSASAHSAGPLRKAPQSPHKAAQSPHKLVFWVFFLDLKIGTKNGRLKMRSVGSKWCPRVTTWSPKSPKITKK